MRFSGKSASYTIRLPLTFVVGRQISMNENFETVLVQFGIEPAMLTARGLCRYEEAYSLETIQIDASGRQHCLIPEAASAWRNMKDAALADGVNLIVVSAFRSVARQAEIIQRKLDAGLNIQEILSVSAPPGYSERQHNAV